MANEMTISNRAAAHISVTDFRTGKDADGNALPFPAETMELLTSGAVGRGELVKVVAPASATAQPTVAPWVTTDPAPLIVGVAFAAAASGARCTVVTTGFCLIDAGAGAPAANGRVVPGAANGKAGVGAAQAATDLNGVELGVWLGTKDAANLAFAYFSRQG